MYAFVMPLQLPGWLVLPVARAAEWMNDGRDGREKEKQK